MSNEMEIECRKAFEEDTRERYDEAVHDSMFERADGGSFYAWFEIEQRWKGWQAAWNAYQASISASVMGDGFPANPPTSGVEVGIEEAQVNAPAVPATDQPDELRQVIVQAISERGLPFYGEQVDDLCHALRRHQIMREYSPLSEEEKAEAAILVAKSLSLHPERGNLACAIDALTSLLKRFEIRRRRP